MLGQIVVQDLKKADAEIGIEMDEDSTSDDPELSQELSKQVKKRDRIESAAQELLTKMLGQRSSRFEKLWARIDNLAAIPPSKGCLKRKETERVTVEVQEKSYRFGQSTDRPGPVILYTEPISETR